MKRTIFSAVDFRAVPDATMTSWELELDLLTMVMCNKYGFGIISVLLFIQETGAQEQPNKESELNGKHIILTGVEVIKNTFLNDKR